MSDRFSRTFAAYAVETTWEGLPAETVHEVERRVLDSIGVAIAALEESAPAAAGRYAVAHPGSATVWGTDARSGAEAAGFANGVAVRALDFNDTYLSLEPLHPSDAIAALLALAEVRGLPGNELIRAIAISYEVSVSLCDAASLRAHGWDHVGFLGIGAACGAGALLGLTTDGLEQAISIAAIPHAAMRQTRAGELSMWKGAAAANAARHAVFGASMAEAGMTGPNEPFEGEMGIIRQLLGGEPFDDEPLKRLEALEPPTRISDTYVKFWPVEYHAQSAVDAALRLHARLAGRDVSSVRIDTFRTSYEIIAKDPEKWDPRTRETADHSIQYIVCAALQDGEVTMATFDPARFRRADTLELLQQRTTVEEDPGLTAGYPDGIPNRVTVTAADGEALTERVDHPRGHARNPMTDDELVAKFRSNVSGRWSAERAERVRHAALGLHEDGGLARLVAELGP
jgi:2-methylcitrate dehydratase